MKRLVSSLLCAIIGALVVVGGADALTSTVTPAFVRLSVSSQYQQATAGVTLTNNEDVEQAYALSITDVDVATGSLLPTNTASDVTKRLLQASPAKTKAAPGTSITVSITATSYEGLPPGGHYAALKIEPTNTSAKIKSSNVLQAFIVPIFVTKEDGAVRTLQAAVTNSKSLYIGSLPKVKFTLKNTGNVDGVPRGFVSAVRGSATYFKQSFNDTSVPLFAGQERTFEVAANKSPNFFGRFKTIVSYKLDGQEKPTIIETTSWFVPWWAVWAGVATVLVVGMFVHRRYKRTRTLVPSSSQHLQTTPETTKKRRRRRPKKQQATAKTKVVSDFGSTKGIK